MAYERRDFEGGAVTTTLASGISNSDTSIVIASATGWPDASAGSFFIVIDPDLSSEEKILCSARTGTTITASNRGQDGTSAASHSSGATVKHVLTARDMDEANYTVAETVGKITAAGQILIGDGANSLAALDVKTSGQIIVGNGTTGVSVAVSGDATLAASGALTIANDAVSLAKMANIATDRLIGRDTAATGDPEALTVGGGIEFTGSGGIQTSAFTGDVTKAAGGTATTIADDAVTYAKMQDVTATSRVLGRITAGAGVVEELTAANVKTILALASTDISDFDEAAQDAVGGMVADTTTIDLTYTDATPELKADVVAGSIGTTQLAASVPRGMLAAPATRTTDVGTFTTSFQDLTSLTITGTPISATRYIRIKGHCHFTSTTANDVIELAIRESTTIIHSVSVTHVTGTEWTPADVEFTYSPTAASHTWKLSARRITGSGNCNMEATSDFDAWMTVEDVGGT